MNPLANPFAMYFLYSLMNGGMGGGGGNTMLSGQSTAPVSPPPPPPPPIPAPTPPPSSITVSPPTPQAPTAASATPPAPTGAPSASPLSPWMGIPPVTPLPVNTSLPTAPITAPTPAPTTNIPAPGQTWQVVNGQIVPITGDRGGGGNVGGDTAGGSLDRSPGSPDLSGRGV